MISRLRQMSAQIFSNTQDQKNTQTKHHEAPTLLNLSQLRPNLTPPSALPIRLDQGPSVLTAPRQLPFSTKVLVNLLKDQQITGDEFARAIGPKTVYVPGVSIGESFFPFQLKNDAGTKYVETFSTPPEGRDSVAYTVSNLLNIIPANSGLAFDHDLEGEDGIGIHPDQITHFTKAVSMRDSTL